MTVYSDFSRGFHILKYCLRIFILVVLLVVIPSFAVAQNPKKGVELLEPFIVRMGWIFLTSSMVV
jgi:hypothetical protein